VSYLGSGSYTTAPAVANSWLEYVNHEYAANIAQWTYARDHYTAEAAAPWNIPSYLHRKKLGEAVEAYEERVLLADYTPHFGAVVDTLAGMITQIEANATRVWGRLGDSEDRRTHAGRVWVDADGDGNGLLTLMQLLATDLVAVHDAWLLVDGVKGDGRRARIRLIEVERVINWRHDPDTGALVEAVMKDFKDTRASVMDNPDAHLECEYILFTTAGFQRYRKVRDAEKREEKVVQVSELEPYAYRTRDGSPTIPLVRVRLPLRRNVGYIMARKANAIFNKESERDHLLRFACFPLLNVVANDTLFGKIKQQLRAGARVLQVLPGNANHNYTAPDSGPAAILNATIEAKILEYYTTAFREFGSAARRQGRERVTATEVKQDLATGVAAFLSLLRNALDNAENAALYLFEQTVFPNDQAKWDLAKVERSTEFGPFDPDEVVARMRDRYFGAKAIVPVGRTARIEAAKQIAAWDGLEAKDEEITADVNVASLHAAVQSVQALLPAMPDEMKAMMVAQFAEAYGLGEHDTVHAAVLKLLKEAPVVAPGAKKPENMPMDKPEDTDTQPTE